MLGVYFPLACITAGSAISSGLVVPMLLIGAIYGRIIGNVCVSIVYGSGVIDYTNPAMWWVDPGIFALIGSASFFGGVSRLTMSLTVIMVEITNDVHMLLPIQTAIIVAKWIADYSTHSLYHALIELKCIPFLDFNINSPMSMEIFSCAQVATKDVVTVTDVVSVKDISETLLKCTHHAFPVTRTAAGPAEGTFIGTIASEILMQILKHPQDTQVSRATVDDLKQRAVIPTLPYGMISDLGNHHNRHASPSSELLQNYARDPKYADLFIDLTPYINTSAYAVQSTFSLERTYILFRAMGLRHLTILGPTNHVEAFLSRKDLMGFKIDEKLDAVIEDIKLGGGETAAIN
jgi:chloride channel 7